MEDQLSTFRKQLSENIMKYKQEVFREIAMLAEVYVEKLNNAMGLPSGETDTRLWKWTLSPEHADVESEICEENSKRDTGFGPGVYTEGNIPSYPGHINCKCSLESLADSTTIMSKAKWQVFITEKGVKFRNDSDMYVAKKEGTPDKIGGAEEGYKLIKSGEKPEDFDTPIIEEFAKEAEAIAEDIAEKIFGSM